MAPSYAIRWAQRPPGGDWSEPQTVAGASCCLGILDLVAGAAGDVTVLWDDEGSPYTSTKRPGSDTWEAPDFVTGGRTDGLRLAVAPDGSAVIARPDVCDSFFVNCVRATYRPPGGDWGPEEIAGNAAGEVSGVALAARRDSSYTVVWGEGAAPIGLPAARSQNPPGAVASSDRAAAGGWSGRRPVTATPGVAPGCPSSTSGCIDLASRGDTLLAVWQQGVDGASGRIAASLRTGGGAWGAAEDVGDDGNGDAFPHAAVTAGGIGVAAWSDGPSGLAVARGAHRGTDGAWHADELGTPREGSASVGDVAADAEGDAVAAWIEPDGFRTAGFDAAGPRFTAFSVPRGRQDEPVQFSAAVRDNWSQVAALGWTFGDGASADGASPSHTYDTGGNFRVTARSTDSLGNSSAIAGTSAIAFRDEITPTPTPDPCGTGDRDADGINDGCDGNDGSAAPRPFKTVNATVVSGDVFYKPPAGAARAAQAHARPPRGFRRLEGAATIPVGSILDTAEGRVLLRSAATTRRRTQIGQFFAGRFRVRQLRAPRRRGERRSPRLITELRLTGSSFARRCSTGRASASQRRKRRVRRLWGDGRGHFRTRGRNAAATVKGTRWLVEDRCDGTLVRVRRGRVEARDLVRRRTVTVRAGRSYLARRRR